MRLVRGYCGAVRRRIEHDAEVDDAGSEPGFDLAVVRFEHDQDLPERVQDIFKTRLFKRFDLIEATLAHHAYLAGHGFTVADAYLFAVLRWMPLFTIDLGRWPGIAEYMQRIAARPSVLAAQAREAEIPPVE